MVGLHGAGGEYVLVGRTDAGAALGCLAGSVLGELNVTRGSGAPCCLCWPVLGE